MNPTFDAVVIGAGYIGCSIAYYLTMAGVKTALIDQKTVAAGASGANYGNLQVQDTELSHSIEMTKRGWQCYETLEQELDWKIGLNKIGSLLPIENENQWNILQDRKEVLNKEGICAELIPANYLTEVEPMINSRILIGGLYHKDEAQIDPFLFMWGLITRARQNGMQTFFNHRLVGFSIENKKMREVKTDLLLISSPNVILCTGAYTNNLGMLLGKKWQIHYVLGQALVTESVPRILHNHLASASFFETNARIERGSLTTNMAISQSLHGNILAGESMFISDQISTVFPYETIPAISQCWLKFFPALKNLRVLRCWSAAVADISDGLPLLGAVPDIEGLYLATAFRSTAIVAPLVGQIMTQLITRNPTCLDIQAFSPERIINE